MSTHNAPRIAHWRIARNPAGKEVDLHPWIPGGLTMLKTATIRHCVGCTACGEAAIRHRARLLGLSFRRAAA